MADIRIYQIYYDLTRQPPLDPGFIPYDNTANKRPEWFEFCPMQDFFNATTLKPDAWYGFVSARFQSKTGWTSSEVFRGVAAIADKADVVLISPAWDQLAFFQSVFENGEYWHPGLIDALSAFFEHEAIELNPRTAVTHSLSSGFSNYVIARPAYWREWLNLANRFFEYAEGGNAALNAPTPYFRGPGVMKGFAQERLMAVVLARNQFRVATRYPPPSHLIGRFFPQNAETAELLKTCDWMKQLYTATGDPAHLRAYLEARKLIPFRFSRVTPKPRT
jgi:hypothetical protein